MQLIICTFDAVARADEVREALEALDRRLDTIKLGHIAIVEKTPEGQVVFRETGDHRNALSQVTGMVAGGVAWFIYAFAGSLGYQAGPAAYTVGYNTAERLVRDSGFPDQALRDLGDQLTAGSSALITLVKPEEAPIVEEELQRLGGTLVQHTIAPEIVAEFGKE